MTETNPYVACNRCNGESKIYVLGGNKERCPSCSGLGYMLRKVTDEQIDVPVIYKKKPGRKPKHQQQDILQVGA